MKIAVIGNGIVGATFVNEMLERHPNSDIVQFDGLKGTATIASAGIIAPWLSKRRNQKWYNLARQGAEFMQEMAQKYQMPKDVYLQSGVIYTRDSDDKLQSLLELAQQRIQNAPQMGDFSEVTSSQIKKLFPFIQSTSNGVFVRSGARIDGQRFIHFLNLRNQEKVQVVQAPAKITIEGQQAFVNGSNFDLVIVAAGAWIAQTLAPLGIQAQVRPQKGQLIEINLPDNQFIDHNAPVLMPEGERDFIPTNDGTLLIGATHENDQGFDLTVSAEIVKDLLASGQRIIPGLSEKAIKHVRVGTRAYTEDFAPFFGRLPQHSQILVASGLGSSGLTTGPIIGKLLVDLIDNPLLDVSHLTKPISTYIN